MYKLLQGRGFYNALHVHERRLGVLSSPAPNTWCFSRACFSSWMRCAERFSKVWPWRIDMSAWSQRRLISSIPLWACLKWSCSCRDRCTNSELCAMAFPRVASTSLTVRSPTASLDFAGSDPELCMTWLSTLSKSQCCGAKNSNISWQCSKSYQLIVHPLNISVNWLVDSIDVLHDHV